MQKQIKRSLEMLQLIGNSHTHHPSLALADSILLHGPWNPSIADLKGKVNWQELNGKKEIFLVPLESH
jgi:hypothetical protein